MKISFDTHFIDRSVKNNICLLKHLHWFDMQHLTFKLKLKLFIFHIDILKNLSFELEYLFKNSIKTKRLSNILHFKNDK